MSEDHQIMKLARETATGFSDDRNTQVGCVIVDSDGRVLASGANRFPRSVDKTVEARHQRPEKYFWIEHAERDAIYSAARAGVPLQGSRCYLPWFPCMDCARALIGAGIGELIAIQPNLADPKWGEDFKRVSVMLAEAGVSVRFLEST